jgi:hypothetical protein
MFEIKYRIVDDLEYLKNINTEEFNKDNADIEGFFQLSFNESIEGYYHSKHLGEYEVGHELITLWFDRLIQTVSLLYITNYVALRNIENHNTWIEFILINNDLKVNLGKYVGEYTNQDIITTQGNHFDYPRWKDAVIAMDVFRDEIISKAKKFINDIYEINPEIVKSNLILKLKYQLNSISK